MAGEGQANGQRQAAQKIGMFHSLGFRNFRLLWVSNLFGSAGMWIQMTTLGWLVFDLTGSSTLLGAMNGVRAIPLLLLAPIAGVVADRVSRRTLMIVLNATIMVIVLALAVGLTLDRVAIWHLFAFTIIGGAIQVFYMPVQQTVIFDLVPRPSIPNAVALGSASFNVTRVLGPSLAGFLIAALGPQGNFFVQGAAYFGVTLTIFMIAIPARKAASGARTSMQGNFLEGIRYVARTPLVRMLLLVGMIPPLLVVPSMMALMPVFAKNVFHGGPGTLGLLMSASGLGGLIGALFAASLGNFERRGLLQLGSLGMASLALVGFAVSPSLVMAIPLLIVAGFCEMMYMTTTQTMLQLSLPDNMRGRITGLFMLNMGLMPLGSLAAGIAADWVGARVVVAAASGAALVLAVLIACFVPLLRRLRLSHLTAGHSSPA